MASKLKIALYTAVMAIIGLGSVKLYYMQRDIKSEITTLTAKIEKHA